MLTNKEYLERNKTQIFKDLDTMEYREFTNKYYKPKTKSNLFYSFMGQDDIWKKTIYNAMLLQTSKYTYSKASKIVGCHQQTMYYIYRGKRCSDELIDEMNNVLYFDDGKMLYRYNDGSVYESPLEEQDNDSDMIMIEPILDNDTEYRSIEGTVTRKFIKESDNGYGNDYIWGLTIDNEFVECPRILSMLSEAGLDTKAGTKIRIEGELRNELQRKA